MRTDIDKECSFTFVYMSQQTSSDLAVTSHSLLTISFMLIVCTI